MMVAVAILGALWTVAAALVAVWIAVTIPGAQGVLSGGILLIAAAIGGLVTKEIIKSG